jgi:hypothetical protein
VQWHTVVGQMSELSILDPLLWTSPTTGLRDLLVDSGVYAGCTVDQILQGKQFNRGVRAYTLAYEALAALNWIEDVKANFRHVLP